MRKLLLSAGWALSLAIPAAARENFSAWKDSVRIFINTSAAGADLDASVKDFPLLVRLDSSSIDFSKVKAGGADLRFADPDGTLLPHEIELFEAAAKSCVAWVRVPQVDAQSVDDHIVLYWNNPAATALKAAVFDTSLGYAAVYHFGEEGAGPLTGPGTKGIFKDATPNQNHGDDFTSDPRARAVIGYGQEFDGMDDRVQVPNKPSLALAGPLSISAWVRGDQYAGNLEQSNVIVRKGDELPVSYQFGVMAGRAFLSLDEKTSDVVWSKGTLAAGTYYHLAGAWEGKTLKLYVNGVLDAEIAVSKSAGSLSKDARPMYVGGRMLSPFDFNSYDLWNGGLDEVRVSRVARSDQYYRLSYENQKAGSRLLSFKPFPPPASSEVLSLWAHSRKILFNTAADGADVAGDVEGFPVPVRLDSRFFTFSEAGAKGEDIRFSDPDGSPLPYAIERWDPPAGKALIWVKVPRVDGGSEADFIRMHWGMNGVPDRQSPTAVFDTAAGFAGVWHLESGAAGRTGTVAYLDQTAGRHHGSDFVLGAPTEGMLGFGQEFAENQDRIKVPAAPTLDFTAALTFSAWIKGTSWDTGETNANPILRKGESNPNAYQLWLESGHLKFGVGTDDGDGLRSPDPLHTGTWYHVTATWQPGRARIYVNGELIADTAAWWSPPPPDNRALYLGGRDSTSGTDQFRGMLDEVQTSRMVRSSDWIRLSYESQRDRSPFLVHEGYEQLILPPDTAATGEDTVLIHPPHATWAWDTTLAAGQRLGKAGVFSLSNPGPGALRLVIVPAASPDTFGAVGVEANIRILSPAGDCTAPIAVFAMDTAAAGGRSVYELLPGVDGNGRLGDLGPASGSVDLRRAGTYVVALDTLEPSLRMLDEGFGGGDSSWVRFVALDNVSLVNLKCFPEGAGAVTSLMRQERSGVPFRLAFKPQAGMVPLKLFLSVDDGRKQSAFPAPPASHHVLSRLLPDVRAPLAAKSAREWSLFGLPVRPSRSLTLDSLARAAGASALHVALWDARLGADGEYRRLAPGDTLPTGSALWLASEKTFADLPLGGCTSLSQGPTSAFSLAIRRGWNLLANPSLEPIPWVVTKADLPAYDRSAVKGLHAYAGNGAYRDADTLEPWKGYFVYSQADTVLRLDGAYHGLPKAARPAPGSIRIDLEPVPGQDGSPAAASLRLGAAAYATDAFGLEDEPMPVTPALAPGVAAIRLGRSLSTDLVRLEPGKPGRFLVWKLAWTRASAPGKLPGAARFRVSGLGVPEGMSLWAASALRAGAAVDAGGAQAEPLAEGGEVGLEGDLADTLVIWAAPAGTWRDGDPIPGMLPAPALRAASLARGPEGIELRLDLPAGAGVKAALHAADGRRLASWGSRRLPAGRHAIPLAGAGAISRGLILVTVEFSGPAGASRRVFKTFLP